MYAASFPLAFLCDGFLKFSFGFIGYANICSFIVLNGLSHEKDFKNLQNLALTWLVFEFFRDSNDFKTLKIYLLRLLPVCNGYC